MLVVCRLKKGEYCMKKVGIILCVFFVALIVAIVFYNRKISSINIDELSPSYGVLITTVSTYFLV